ncbi:hypothetical protein [Nannocystis punicea]|uniref:Baseplate assembly protein n=1 Tax=Nannocystis punicea TaxID=2995304 RepID=A0ABY7H6W0_9BACT|nr:hypothetical protein [Nannocystis poenicansa]WAS94835.1 hypothetical protein O0S08_01630 [Nannocystis poenicansa]
MTRARGTRQVPDVDYLTRDYRGLREQLIALVTRSGSPWTERSAADVGMVVLEALAYSLDHLAYAGDRAAAEGFLRTAKERQSVRLHAALGDYVLDRGATSTGYQHFAVRDGVLRLPARTTVNPRLEREQDREHRDVFETVEAALLDSRHNGFTLRKSVGAGTSVLWLGGPRREALDLWSIGVRPGLLLALVSRDRAELVKVAVVQGSAVVLAQPVGATYVADDSDRAGKVLGNLVPIRRGQQSEWQLLGRGGMVRDESPVDYHRQRVAMLRLLSEHVERQRGVWQARGDLRRAWEEAQQTVARAVCLLRTISAQALSVEDDDRIEAWLTRAADLLRKLSRAAGVALPPGLEPTRFVAAPRQRVKLPPEKAPVWDDPRPILGVRTLVGGQVQEWQEVEDFLRSGPTDRHYVVELADARDVALRFGDGVHGAMVPPGAPILGQWVFGDPALGDLGARALIKPAGSIAARLDPRDPTYNPLPTTGARPIEMIDIADRLRHRLSIPAIPVTAGDYVDLFTQRLEVIEAAVVPTTRRLVRVALRLADRIGPAQALTELQEWIEPLRLAGTQVRLSLARPLYVSVTAAVQLHAEADPEAVQGRCKAAVRERFSPRDEPQLGVPCSKAELLAIVEAVIGVESCELYRFGRAEREDSEVLEVVEPAPDQVLRCEDDPAVAATGQIQVLIVREYSLVVEYHRHDPDTSPDDVEIHGALYGALSGPRSIPAVEEWPEISRHSLEDLLATGQYSNERFVLKLRALIVGERRVERIPLRPGDVPLLRSLQIIPIGTEEDGA